MANTLELLLLQSFFAISRQFARPAGHAVQICVIHAQFYSKYISGSTSLPEAAATSSFFSLWVSSVSIKAPCVCECMYSRHDAREATVA